MQCGFGAALHVKNLLTFCRAVNEGLAALCCRSHSRSRSCSCKLLCRNNARAAEIFFYISLEGKNDKNLSADVSKLLERRNS